MGEREHSRRKRLIVDREAQKRIILAVTLFPSISLAMAAMIIAIFCRRLLGEAVRAEAELPSLVPLFLSILGFLVVSAVIILHQAVKFSNRIWGPCYRLLKAFDEIKAGNLGCRIRLREGDHLTEVADAFNDLAAWLAAHPPAGVAVEPPAAADGAPPVADAPGEAVEAACGSASARA